MPMEDARTGAALRRIEAAMLRIETAARRGIDRSATAEMAHLAARHDALRGEAEATIAALDRLIAESPR
jgi:hypothetical protein